MDEIELKGITTSVERGRLPLLPSTLSRAGAQTQTVSSTGIVATPTIRESQTSVDPSSDLAWQREQSRMDAIRTAAALRGASGPTGASVAPSQIAVTTTLAVVGRLKLEEPETSEASRQVPVGSIAPSTERCICQAIQMPNMLMSFHLICH